MNNQGGEQSGERLNPLPPSNDEFWTGVDAEVHTNIVPQRVHSEDAHYFIRTTGRQAQCTHCDWGFELDPGDKIADGHLYDKAGNLVI